MKEDMFDTSNVRNLKKNKNTKAYLYIFLYTFVNLMFYSSAD